MITLPADLTDRERDMLLDSDADGWLAPGAVPTDRMLDEGIVSEQWMDVGMPERMRMARVTRPYRDEVSAMRAARKAAGRNRPGYVAPAPLGEWRDE